MPGRPAADPAVPAVPLQPPPLQKPPRPSTPRHPRQRHPRQRHPPMQRHLSRQHRPTLRLPTRPLPRQRRTREPPARHPLLRMQVVRRPATLPAPRSLRRPHTPTPAVTTPTRTMTGDPLGTRTLPRWTRNPPWTGNRHRVRAAVPPRQMLRGKPPSSPPAGPRIPLRHLPTGQESPPAHGVQAARDSPRPQRTTPGHGLWSRPQACGWSEIRAMWGQLSLLRASPNQADLSRFPATSRPPHRFLRPFP